MTWNIAMAGSPTPAFRQHSPKPYQAVLLLTIVGVAVAGCTSPAGDWKAASDLNTVDAYRQFLDKHPESEQRAEAIQRIYQLAWQDADSVGSAEAYQNYREKYPESSMAVLAADRIDSIAYEAARNLNTIAAYETFLSDHPDAAAASSAREAIAAIQTRQRFPLYERGFQALEVTGSTSLCSPGETKLRANRETFVAAADLRTVFGWNGSDRIAASGPDGATIEIDSLGRPVYRGSWCLGNMLLVGPVRIGGGLLLGVGAIIGLNR